MRDKAIRNTSISTFCTEDAQVYYCVRCRGIRPVTGVPKYRTPAHPCGSSLMSGTPVFCQRITLAGAASPLIQWDLQLQRLTLYPSTQHWRVNRDGSYSWPSQRIRVMFSLEQSSSSNKSSLRKGQACAEFSPTVATSVYCFLLSGAITLKIV